MRAEVRLRGHHVLCMLGFRGLGYSAEFVANMRAVVDKVRGAPDLSVELIAGPDAICSACPHLSESGCAHKESAEVRVRAKDRTVLAALGVHEGAHMPAAELRGRVADRVSLTTLESLCRRCSWWGRGYCAEGLAKLRASHEGG